MDYLDNRLFQVAQTLEFLAMKWIPAAALPDDENELRGSLKKICRDWIKLNPHADPSGRIVDRVIKAFGWPVLRRQIDGLVFQSGLDLSFLGLALEHLKSARDSVAHSITLEGVNAFSGPHHELLMCA